MAIPKNKIESLHGHSFPTIWLMNLIFSFSIDMTSLYNQLLYFNWLHNRLGWQNQLNICTVIKVTPRKGWNHSWPNKLGITKLGTEQDKAFSYTSTAAIQDSNKSGHMRALQTTFSRKVPYFPNWCVYLESLPCKCDAHAILTVQSNRVRFVTTVTKWFQLQHLGNARKIAKSRRRNTLEWWLLAVCIQYRPWSAYTSFRLLS